MIDPHTISRPDGPVNGTATIGQIKRHLQGTVACLLSTVLLRDAACAVAISGNRVLCGRCRERLLAAGVTSLTFDGGRQVVDVDVNEATLIDRVLRIA